MLDPENQRRWFRGMALFSAIVAEIIGFSGAGLGLGYLAWKKLHFPDWGMAITSFAGLGVAMVRVYRLIQSDIGKTKNE